MNDTVLSIITIAISCLTMIVSGYTIVVCHQSAKRLKRLKRLRDGGKP